MRTDEIKIGEIYYFNNREVLILARECETDFFRCATKFILPDNFSGRDFCGHCLVGGGSNMPVMDCDADVYQEALDSIIEEIENNKINHDIIFVHSLYLQHQPFEYKTHHELKNKNNQIEQDISNKSLVLKELEESIEAIKNDLEALSEIKDSKSKEIDKLNLEIENFGDQVQELKKQVISGKPIIIENSEKTIPINKVLSLIKDSIVLENLENGGVDNWEWYEESVGTDEIIQKQALEKLINL